MLQAEKLTRGASLSSVHGIPARLHYTWYLAFVFMTIGLALYFRGTYPLWEGIVLGLAACLLFLGSMCARELARTWVAINRRIGVKSVTLYVFGGVPRVPEGATRPAAELMAAATGPLSSVIIAGIFLAAQSLLARAGILMVAELMGWLVYLNIMIALFNLVPGFPLDGGRGLRAIIWMATGNFRQGMGIASLAGRVIGLLFVLAGIVVTVVAGEWFTGPVLAVAGWFLADAAASARRQNRVRQALDGVTARYMMTEGYTPIKQQLTFGLVRDFIINSGQHCFLVIEEGRLEGIVTLGDIQIPQKRWNSTQIGQIMTPASELKTAHPGEPAAEVLEQMNDYDLDQMPVLEKKSRIVGMVTRDRLIRFLTARAVLKA